MEQLLFLAFIVLSVGSALYDRHKKQLAEEARRAQRQARSAQAAPVPAPEVRRLEETPDGRGWPAADDQPEPRPASRDWTEAPTTDQEARQDAPDDSGAEGETRATERRTRELERLSKAATRGVARPPRRRPEGRRDASEQAAINQAETARGGPGQALLDPARARQAVIWAEIIGPPVSMRPPRQ